jgi:hypothetical protein
MRDLTDQEKRVVDALGNAWDEYALLPHIHPADVGEFVQAVHAAQNIVLARPGVKAVNPAAPIFKRLKERTD